MQKELITIGDVFSTRTWGIRTQSSAGLIGGRPASWNCN